MKIKKTLSVILSIIMLLMIVPSFSVYSVVFAESKSVENDDLPIGEVVELLNGWEHVYMVAFFENNFSDYMIRDEDGKLTGAEKMEHRRRKYDKSEYEDRALMYIQPCIYQTVDELKEYIEKTYTKEMTEKILNNSLLIFKDNKVYYSCEILDGHYPVAVSEMYNVFNALPPLEDRITITDLPDGVKQIEFVYWDATAENIERWLYSGANPSYPMNESKTGTLKVKKTLDGYRICDFDDILIKEDKLAAQGFRMFRFVEENPQTSDTPIIAVCALAISAAAAVVVLKKKRI